jgi:hypothetical protein
MSEFENKEKNSLSLIITKEEILNEEFKNLIPIKLNNDNDNDNDNDNNNNSKNFLEIKNFYKDKNYFIQCNLIMIEIIYNFISTNKNKIKKLKLNSNDEKEKEKEKEKLNLNLMKNLREKYSQEEYVNFIEKNVQSKNYINYIHYINYNHKNFLYFFLEFSLIEKSDKEKENQKEKENEYEYEKLTELVNEEFDILISLDFFEVKINKEKNNSKNNANDNYIYIANSSDIDYCNYFSNLQFDNLMENLYHKKSLSFINNGI